MANVAGTVAFEFVILKVEEKWADLMCVGLIVAELAVLVSGTLFLEPDKRNSGLYIMMVTLIGFMSGGAGNRIGTADFL